MNKLMLMTGFLIAALAAGGQAQATEAPSSIRAEGQAAIERLELELRESLLPASREASPAGSAVKPAIYLPGGVGFSIEPESDGRPAVPAMRSF